MYGLKNETSLDFLIGKTLEQVCIGSSVNLNFSDLVSMSIESKFEILKNGEEDSASGRGKDVQKLVELLGHDIISVEKINDGGICIKFATMALRIYDSNDAYESYVITSPHGTIVV